MFIHIILGAVVGAFLITAFARSIERRGTLRTVGALATPGTRATALVRRPLESTQSGHIEHSQTAVDLTMPVERLSADDQLNTLLFRAGIFSEVERRRYRLWRWITPCLVGCFSMACVLASGSRFIWPPVCVCVLIGIQIPRSYLRRRIARRDEEILFYLPLVIEEMVLGVGSSLDIGPCMKWVVDIADERDSHNAVTELLQLAQRYMKSGLPIDESLAEVARSSGHTELKHVFMSLSQVVKHGGEVTKQLQELANAVATQREVKIEGQIKALEIKATGPVAMVFASFMGLFLTSLGIQMFSAFK